MMVETVRAVGGSEQSEVKIKKKKTKAVNSDKIFLLVLTEHTVQAQQML